MLGLECELVVGSLWRQYHVPQVYKVNIQTRILEMVCKFLKWSYVYDQSKIKFSFFFKRTPKGPLKVIKHKIWKFWKLKKAIFWKNTAPNQKNEENRPPQNQPKNWLAKSFKHILRKLQHFFKMSDSGDNWSMGKRCIHNFVGCACMCTPASSCNQDKRPMWTNASQIIITSGISVEPLLLIWYLFPTNKQWIQISLRNEVLGHNCHIQ